jgi:putative endonuclease
VAGKSKNPSRIDPWFLYVAECADGTYYTGIAKDVQKRIASHNEGKGAKYTRAHGPVKLLLQEPQADYSAALKREYQVKRLTKKRKTRFVSGEALPPPGMKAKMSFQKPRRKKRRKRRKSHKIGN